MNRSELVWWVSGEAGLDAVSAEPAVKAMLAMFSLGRLHLDGKGVDPDPVEVYAWFNLAAPRGFSEAVEPREDLVAYMTQAEINRDQELAREFEKHVR